MAVTMTWAGCVCLFKLWTDFKINVCLFSCLDLLVNTLCFCATCFSGSVWSQNLSVARRPFWKALKSKKWFSKRIGLLLYVSCGGFISLQVSFMFGNQRCASSNRTCSDQRKEGNTNKQIPNQDQHHQENRSKAPKNNSSIKNKHETKFYQSCISKKRLILEPMKIYWLHENSLANQQTNQPHRPPKESNPKVEAPRALRRWTPRRSVYRRRLAFGLLCIY